jgi:hypothetical protein
MLMYTSAETVFIVIKLKIRQRVFFKPAVQKQIEIFMRVGDIAISGLFLV